jgi:dTDP-4-amino-4,6-dideoxygalactose transaminase
LRVSVGDFKLGPGERAAIMEVLDSNRITEGVKVAKFERLFSQYLGVKETVLVNSGTSALITGLNALGYTKPSVRPGTNIITTPLTYIATTNAITLSGFKPSFVDVDMETFNITPKSIEAHLESIDDPTGYSAILPVHLMGYPADMDGINRIAREHDFAVLEDSAQAHGSLYKKRMCGSMSEASAFSFYIAHNIQVGEMGALSTNDEDVAAFARRFKANGRMCDCKICTRSKGTCPRLKIEGNLDPRFHHIHIGYNFKATDIMASIGIEQLRKADEIKEQRYRNVQYLNEGLEFLQDKLQLPALSRDVSYLAYPLIVKGLNISREKVTRQLEKRGVETRPLFSCIPLHQPAYSEYQPYYRDKLPNAEYLGSKGFYIGCHQYLEEEHLNYIVKTFKEIHW